MGSALTRILFDGTDGLKPSRFWTLMAIAHFVNDQQALKTGEGSCWPTVDTIAKKAHLSPNIVRDSIKDLVDEKVLRFEQPAGGRRTFYVRVEDIKRVAGASTNSPLSDVTGVTDVKPLSDVTGVPLQICEESPCRSVTTPLSDLKPEQRKEQRKEQEKRTKKVCGAPAPAPADDLFGGELKEEKKPKDEPTKTASKRSLALGEKDCPQGVESETWAEVLYLRRQKRAPLTPIALKRIEAEAKKAGITLQTALTEMLARGWQGFKADWYLRDRKPAAETQSIPKDMTDAERLELTKKLTTDRFGRFKELTQAQRKAIGYEESARAFFAAHGVEYKGMA